MADTVAAQELAGVELVRQCIRLHGMEESKRDAAADYALQIKACKKEILRLSWALQRQTGLFEG